MDARISFLLVLASSLFLFNFLKPILTTYSPSSPSVANICLENSGLAIQNTSVDAAQIKDGSRAVDLAPFFFEPIPINHASTALLTTLPGVGEVLAQAIVTRRERTGFFTNPSDLLAVKGVGRKRMIWLSKLVSFEQ